MNHGLPLPQPTKSGAMVVPATMPGVPVTAPKEWQKVLEKVFLKAAYNGSGKKDVKTFTLRKVDPRAITSSGDLKKIRLKPVWVVTLPQVTLMLDICREVMSSGCIQPKTYKKCGQIWTRWRAVMTLWCDGLVDGKISKRKQQTLSEDESEDEPPRPKKTCR